MTAAERLAVNATFLKWKADPEQQTDALAIA